jgi:PleD family two-component response regulator
MSTNEVSFRLRSEGVEHPTVTKTLGDNLSRNVAIEYNDHYQALRDATVMMVDDEPTTIDILQAFLENEGYRRFVTTSESSRAMELVASANPDAVLLDLHMPKVTGFDILGLLRGDSRYRHTSLAHYACG